MRPQEYMELIWQLEQRCKLDTWRAGGVDLWPVVRFRIADELRAKDDKDNQGTASQGSPRGVRKLLQAMSAQRKASRHDSAHNAGPAQRADVLVLHHSAYRSLAGGVYYDRLLDYLREELARRGITSLGLEYCPSGAFRTPRALPTHYIQGELHLANLANRLAGMTRRVGALQLESLHEFTEAAQPMIAGWPGLTVKQLARQAGLLQRWASLFTRYLKSNGAKLALTTYYYSMEGMALCLAARRLGIPCVDVQHGVQGRYHFAYGPWQCKPAGGYNTLPGAYWCWDNEGTSSLAEAVAPLGARVLTGGNPWQALWEDAASPLTAHELVSIDSATAAHRECKHILLSLQWDHGLTKQLRELIAASPANWHWWVRPHPVQARGREAVRAALEQCAPGRYELDLAADAPLPLLLARLDVHVTRSSTVVREAAQAGMRSLVLDPAARDHYAAELDRGMATAAETQDGALAALAELLALPRDAVQHGSQRALANSALDELVQLAGLDAGQTTPR